jgi:hypothetical protein
MARKSAAKKQNIFPPPGSSLRPEASAEPELGDFQSAENVVATIELTDLHQMKDGAQPESYSKVEPTVAIIPEGDILPMDQQEKLGGGK